MATRPLWAEISTAQLRRNFQHLRSLAGSSELLAIVKANAYGHGATLCAEALSAEGAKWLGVTSVEEGVSVRAAVPGTSILVMGGVWETAGARLALEHGLTPVVWEPFHLDWLLAAARETGDAQITVHVEIDSGMSRQGVQPKKLKRFFEALAAAPSIRVGGVMTHFHSSESLDGAATLRQMSVFAQAVEDLFAAGHRPDWIHAGSSAAVIDQIAMPALVALAATLGTRAMMRPGLALYGYTPDFEGNSGLLKEAEAAARPLQPVLAWKTRILSVREIETGQTVGYCEGFRAGRPSRIALLPVGYADGLRRSLSPGNGKGGDVLLHGRRAPFAGRISMDLASIDVTDIPEASVGDEVVIIGRQGEESITAADHARLSHTIHYEILCDISARVPRVKID